jgi:hypothetical protein
LVGQIPVVDATQQLKIVRAVVAPAGKGLLVVKLQPFARLATSSPCVYKRTLVPIALAHRPPDRRRDVARFRRRFRLFEAFSRGFRLGKTLGFELLELFSDSFIDNRGQVAIRY